LLAGVLEIILVERVKLNELGVPPLVAQLGVLSPEGGPLVLLDHVLAVGEAPVLPRSHCATRVCRQPHHHRLELLGVLVPHRAGFLDGEKLLEEAKSLLAIFGKFHVHA